MSFVLYLISIPLFIFFNIDGTNVKNTLKYNGYEHDRTTCGYIISRNIAEFLIDKFNKDILINLPIDHWLIKIFRDNKIKIYDSKPLLCYSPIVSDSDIR
jgi:hypothetical protein